MSVVYDNEAGRFVNTDDAKLRDLFAMAALTGLLANSEGVSVGAEPIASLLGRTKDGRWLAETSYILADAMMEARK